MAGRKADVFAGRGSPAGKLQCRRKALERGDPAAAAACMRDVKRREREILRDGTTPDRRR